MRTHHRTLNLIGTAVLLSLLLGACNMPASRGASVWLDVPLDGLSFPAVQEVNIEGHASGPGGISRVEIWINGVRQNRVTGSTDTQGRICLQSEGTPIEFRNVYLVPWDLPVF